jgi:HK97 family phage major capsid protein
MDNILSAAKRGNSLRDTYNEYCAVNDIQHDDEHGIVYPTGTSTYGINDMDMLFPDLKNVTNTPTWISRRMEWVDVILKGVHRTPFSRIKSLFADITKDEARAKGYIKGNQKVTEVFSTLKRTTTPTTIYKLQKVDRDDVIDITDFDVISWIKSEMRVMLDEEIARAILVGDGRQSTDDDYINRDNIRPIVSDADLFNVKVGINTTIPTDVSNQTAIDAFAKTFVNSVIFNYRRYKGSGNPTAFMQEAVLSCLLLAEDGMGRKLYPTMETLKTALRVKDIVTVEVMEGVNVQGCGEAMCILVNLNDYNVGADKGGAISMFDDFDINFNKNEYLIETRISGALVRPYSAMTIFALGD